MSERRPASSVMLVDVETTATFRLFGGPGLTAAAVTTHLGIAPSRAFEVGDPMSARSGRLACSSGWMLYSGQEIESGVEVAEQLERLLVVLHPLKDPLWELVDRGYTANWFCYVASNPAEHAVELERSLLERVMSLPGDLWLDVCGDSWPESR